MTVDALLARMTPAALATALAATCWGLSPSTLTRALAVMGALLAGAGAVAPGSSMVTLSLLVLAGEYAEASSSSSGVVVLVSAVAFGVVLWAVHHLFAFAAVVPSDAAVDRSAVRAVAARIAATSALAAPLIVVLLVIADAAPTSPELRGFGVVAAAVAALLPAWVVRRRAASAVSPRE